MIRRRRSLRYWAGEVILLAYNSNNREDSAVQNSDLSVNAGFDSILDAYGKYQSFSSSAEIMIEKGIGNLNFNVYGISDSGFSQGLNSDNIYLNGVYMKNFQYSHYSKGINTASNNALFAVCSCRDRDDESGKRFLSELDKQRRDICAGGYSRANNVINWLTASRGIVSSPNMEFCSLFLDEDGVSVYSLGGARVYAVRGGKLEEVTNSDEYKNTFVGQDGAVSAGKSFPIKKSGEKYLLCSSVVSDSLAQDTMQSILESSEPKKAANDIVDKVNAMNGGKNVNASCIIVEVDAKAVRPVRSKKFIAAVSSLTAAAVVLVLLLLGAIWYSGRDSQVIDDSGTTIAEVQTDAVLSSVSKKVKTNWDELVKFDELYTSGTYEPIKDSDYSQAYTDYVNTLQSSITTVTDYKNRTERLENIVFSPDKEEEVNALEAEVTANLEPIMTALLEKRIAADTALRQKEADDAAAAAAASRAQSSRSSGSSSADSSSGTGSNSGSSSGGSGSRSSGSSSSSGSSGSRSSGGSSSGGGRSSSRSSSGGSSSGGSRRSGGSSSGGSSSGGSMSASGGSSGGSMNASSGSSGGSMLVD